MKIKNEYSQNIMNSEFLNKYSIFDFIELIGGISFYNKKDLIKYTQGQESDWITDITGPIEYKNLSNWEYEECITILQTNKTPFYFSAYLVTDEQKDWVMLNNPSPWE